MGGEKGETCEVWKDGKSVLTYVSREVLFDITGFYQWFVGSSRSRLQMTDKNVSQIRTLKTAYWTKRIEYSIEYQDIRGHARDCMETNNKFVNLEPRDATLCILRNGAPARSMSGHFKAFSLSVPFASQMSADPWTCPYESKLSTDCFTDRQPLSFLFGQAIKSAGWMPWH